MKSDELLLIGPGVLRRKAVDVVPQKPTPATPSRKPRRSAEIRREFARAGRR